MKSLLELVILSKSTVIAFKVRSAWTAICDGCASASKASVFCFFLLCGRVCWETSPAVAVARARSAEMSEYRCTRSDTPLLLTSCARSTIDTLPPRSMIMACNSSARRLWYARNRGSDEPHDGNGRDVNLRSMDVDLISLPFAVDSGPSAAAIEGAPDPVPIASCALSLDVTAALWLVASWLSCELSRLPGYRRQLTSAFAITFVTRTAERTVVMFSPSRRRPGLWWRTIIEKSERTLDANAVIVSMSCSITGLGSTRFVASSLERPRRRCEPPPPPGRSPRLRPRSASMSSMRSKWTSAPTTAAGAAEAPAPPTALSPLLPLTILLSVPSSSMAAASAAFSSGAVDF